MPDALGQADPFEDFDPSEIEVPQTRDLALGPAPQVTRELFEQTLQEIAKHAAGRFSEEGSMPPTLLFPCIGPDGKIARVDAVPVAPFFQGAEREREALRELADRLMEDPNHDLCVLAIGVAKVPKAALAVAGLGLGAAPEELLHMTLRSRESQAVVEFPVVRQDGAFAGFGEAPLVFDRPEALAPGARFLPPPRRVLH